MIKRGYNMRKIMKGSVLGILISIMVAMPVMADENVQTFRSETSQSATVQIYDRRGNWIADGLLSINNPRNGKIGIYMSTQCHVPVDEIEMDISVEQYVNGDWQQVDYLTFNFFPENNKDLTEASVDFQLGGHPANQTYRLDGVHFVYKGSGSESLNGITGGLLITDH